jgi:TIR domain
MASVSQAEIFISYAHEDNVSPFSAEGWVTSFHRALERYLVQLVGRQLKLSVWCDPRMRGNDVIDGELAGRLSKATALVCVVSPSYLGSDWCRRERELFLKAVSSEAGKSRLFKVLKIPVKLETLPGEMQNVRGYQFFREDDERDTFMPLDPSIDPSLMRDYWLKFNDLAQDLSRLLLSLFQPPAPGPTPSKPKVYLADTTFDLQREHDEVKRELLHHGYRVVPDESLPLRASQLQSFVEAQLAECRLSIHMVGRKYGIVPEETQDSVVALQNAVAARRSGSGPLTRLIWLPPGLEPEDERQAKLIEDLRRDNRNHLGADLLETSLEDLKTVIHQRLAGPEAPPRSQAPDDLVRVYVICDQRDVEACTALTRHLLEDPRFEVISPVFEGTEEELRRDHEENLASCDVVVIYYGEGNELWRRRKQRELLRSAGYGRQRKLLASAIYVAPPPSPYKEGLRTNEAVVLRSDATTALDAFLRGIRDARARHAG